MSSDNQATTNRVGTVNRPEHVCKEHAKYDGREFVCSECGLVLEEQKLDRRPAWGSPEEQRTKRQNGAPITPDRHDKGLSTQIGYDVDDSVSSRRKQMINRIRQQNKMSKVASKREYNRVYAFVEIRRIVSSLSLPKPIRKQACQLFKSAQSKDLLNGRSIEGFAAASVYATCRVQSIPRTRGEIVSVARADANELKIAYNALNKELGLPVGPIDPAEYIPRYASELDLDPTTEQRARELIEILQNESLIGGKNPSGVAASCLYMATTEQTGSERITQAEFADVADVSRLTISATVTDLKELV